jgi:translation initiation factor 4B
LSATSRSRPPKATSKTFSAASASRESAWPSLDGKPRGFGYVEFETVDGLKNALTATGTDLQGRSVRVSVAEAKESRFGRADEASTWERSGPLPSLPGRSGGFGAARSTGGFGSDRPGGGYEEVERDAPVRGGKFVPSAPSEPRRGFSNYGAEGGSSRAPYAEVERDAPVRGGKFVPSEPTAPRRMFSDREPSRADEGSWERKGPSGVPPRGTGFGAGSRTRESLSFSSSCLRCEAFLPLRGERTVARGARRPCPSLT